jgi:hypothetical protein
LGPGYAALPLELGWRPAHRRAPNRGLAGAMRRLSPRPAHRADATYRPLVRFVQVLWNWHQDSSTERGHLDTVERLPAPERLGRIGDFPSNFNVKGLIFHSTYGLARKLYYVLV